MAAASADGSRTTHELDKKTITDALTTYNGERGVRRAVFGNQAFITQLDNFNAPLPDGALTETDTLELIRIMLSTPPGGDASTKAFTTLQTLLPQPLKTFFETANIPELKSLYSSIPKTEFTVQRLTEIAFCLALLNDSKHNLWKKARDTVSQDRTISIMDGVRKTERLSNSWFKECQQAIINVKSPLQCWIRGLIRPIHKAFYQPSDTGVIASIRLSISYGLPPTVKLTPINTESVEIAELFSTVLYIQSIDTRTEPTVDAPDTLKYAFSLKKATETDENSASTSMRTVLDVATGHDFTNTRNFIMSAYSLLATSPDVRVTAEDEADRWSTTGCN